MSSSFNLLSNQFPIHWPIVATVKEIIQARANEVYLLSSDHKILVPTIKSYLFAKSWFYVEPCQEVCKHCSTTCSLSKT